MTQKKWTDGVHKNVPQTHVPPWFQELRSAGEENGLRVECVLSRSAQRRHVRIQFQLNGGGRKWWRVAYWHPHNGRLFFVGQPGFAEFDDWEETLKAVLEMCGLVAKS